jgi:hypothetical protein
VCGLPTVDPTTLGYIIALVAAIAGSLGGTALGYHLSRRQARLIEARESTVRSGRAATKIAIELAIAFDWAGKLPEGAGEVNDPGQQLDEAQGVSLLDGVQFLDVTMDLPQDVRETAVHAVRLCQDLRRAVSAARQLTWKSTFEGEPWTKQDSENRDFASAYQSVVHARATVLAEVLPVVTSLKALADKKPPPL